MVYRQNLRAQTAITEIHSTHQDMVFDLSASFSCTDDVFPREAVQSSLFFSFFFYEFISVIGSFELKIMCRERSGRRLFGSVAVIPDLWFSQI